MPCIKRSVSRWDLAAHGAGHRPAHGFTGSDLLRRHRDQLHALVRGLDGAPPALGVAHLQQALDNGRPGGRGAQPRALHALPQGLVLDLPPGVLHGRQQAGVRVRGGRLGGALLGLRLFHRARIPGGKGGQRGGVLFGIVFLFAPALLFGGLLLVQLLQDTPSSMMV